MFSALICEALGFFSEPRGAKMARDSPKGRPNGPDWCVSIVDQSGEVQKSGKSHDFFQRFRCVTTGVRM